MKFVVFALTLLGLSGCASSQKEVEHFSHLRVNSGVEVTPAVISNPFPVCERPIQIARLDKVPELQVFVDVEDGGVICKSTRF
jgi:hypothetical protein